MKKTCKICGSTELQNEHFDCCVKCEPYVIEVRGIMRQMKQACERESRYVELWDSLSDESKFGIALLVSLMRLQMRRRTDRAQLGALSGFELICRLIEEGY